jgi:hypothetical protein
MAIEEPEQIPLNCNKVSDHHSKSIIVIDDVLKELNTRVAGHDSIRKMGNNVLKFIGQKERAINEVYFYESQIDRIPGLKNFTPKYHGLLRAEGRDYIVLEDVTTNFDRPTIIDVKIGTSKLKDNNKVKLCSKIAKFPLQQKIGLRIAGALVYQKVTRDYKNYRDGEIFKDLIREDNIPEIFRDYLFNDGTCIRTDVIRIILYKLRQLLDIMSANTLYRFVSSSILIIYEGDSEHSNNPHCDIRLIDFVHVYDLKEDERDESFLTGLRNMINSLEQCLVLNKT